VDGTFRQIIAAAARSEEKIMRLVLGMLACMGTGAIALADPPPSTPTQPAASSVPTASVPATAPAAAAPATAPAASTSHEAPAATDQREKLLRLKGYRSEMRHGEKMYCRSEEVLGSRLGGRKVCGTVEQLEDREHMSKEMLETAQRTQSNPPK
jgi:hypothetical protein